MRIPRRPPRWGDLIPTPELYRLGAGISPEPGGRYRHWETLRLLTPPAGLTAEQHWFFVKLSRAGILRTLPLVDSKREPFRVAMPYAMQGLLHAVDKHGTGSLQSATESFPIDQANKDYYLVRSLTEEAISSSLLEGAATTRALAKEMLRTKRPPQNRGERMVLNNYKAIQHIRPLVRERLTVDHVVELQRILTADTQDDPTAVGRLRTDEDRVVVEDATGEVLHVPPPAGELAGRLAAMCAFANRDNGKSSEGFMHPVVQSILLHFWLAYDHPFVDGNGRTARALFYWSMMRHGYWMTEFVTLSTILNRAPAKYGRAFLYTETDDNDVTYFVLHQLHALTRAIDELYAYVALKSKETRATEDLLRRSESFNHRQVELLTRALKHPGERFTIDAHAGRHKVAYQTARTDLMGLEERHLFAKQRVGKKLVFSAAPSLEERVRRA